MPSLRYFDHAEGRVAALYEPGERATVVLIHGNSADSETFAAQVSMLRENGFGVLAPDLPGHGRSSDAAAPAQTYSFPGYAAAVASLLDALAVPEVHVAGWSLGGHVGLELLGHDARVRSLLIWGTPPVKPGSEVLDQAFILSPAMAFAGQAALEAREVALYARAMAGDAALALGLERAIARTDGAARTWMMRNGIGGVGLDARDLATRDPRPLAVLHGDADPFIQLAYLRGIAYRNLWGGQVHVLPGVGHAAHLQAPDTFNAMLLAFLLAST